MEGGAVAMAMLSPGLYTATQTLFQIRSSEPASVDALLLFHALSCILRTAPLTFFSAVLRVSQSFVD